MHIKRKINRISPLTIGAGQLALLALAVLDEIPAAEIKLYRNNNITNYDFVTLLGSMNIAAYTASLPDETTRSKNHIATICVSNNPHDAALLQRLVHMRNCSDCEMSTSFHIAHRALIGHPFSSIEGFVTKQLLQQQDHLLEQDQLLMFPLSQNHWKEELETVARWRKRLEKDAPDILQRLDNIVIA